ncbi:hypothetical protein F3Y22_tig00000778pilonHSYRG00351 [Hibiscus syriacus]|uniref:Uncharacterized protein n=1 Tax=Hibiscus syriacus TaxID=106335 RepID=A0A6A3CXA8_HIBSY|nr:hypothetical protein F3Y22_tig00000778pilonHSYRG00351 [Hibiscus syriacus]
MLKSPPWETLWDSSEGKSPAEAAPWSIIRRSLESRPEANAAKSNSEKKGPCNTVLTQWTAHSFDSCTSWYNIPPSQTKLLDSGSFGVIYLSPDTHLYCG